MTGSYNGTDVNNRRMTGGYNGTDVNDRRMPGGYNGTDVNDRRMPGSYNGTDVNDTGTRRRGLPEGSKGISQGIWRVGGANAKHHGNRGWRRRQWICNGTCVNRTCG
jgi:lipoprotein-anchoring transpeptidase ErfK/SrfK